MRNLFKMNQAKTKKMKRYQVKRWDKRNTLLFWKYAVPALTSMWLFIVGIVGSILYMN